MALVEAPQPEDEVVTTRGGAGVYIEPEAAQLLADQVLDADVDEETMTFSVHPQGLNGDGGAERARVQLIDTRSMTKTSVSPGPMAGDEPWSP